MRKNYLLLNSAAYALMIFFVQLSFKAEAKSTVSSISGSLYDVTSILTRVMWAACIVTGIILSMAAFSQFQHHRRNPKLVSLGGPATYVILALLCFAIPFLGDIFRSEDSYAGSQRGKTTTFYGKGKKSAMGSKGSGYRSTKGGRSNIESRPSQTQPQQTQPPQTQQQQAQPPQTQQQQAQPPQESYNRGSRNTNYPQGNNSQQSNSR